MFLDLVDEAAPGLVEGLYLHGSLGFGEWHEGRSDVDFVAVTAERPDVRAVRLLRDVHARAPRLADVDVWTDTRVLQEFTHGNLEGYWAGSLSELRRFPRRRPGRTPWRGSCWACRGCTTC